MKRRTFLKMSGSAGLGMILNPFDALGSTLSSTGSTEGAFVFIVVRGGMDVTLGLDPWLKLPKDVDTKDMFIEYTPNDVVSGGNDLLFGPSAKVLKPFANDIAIVNGIFQNDLDNGHEANLQYIRTGNGLGTSPSAGVIVNQSLGEVPLSLLALNTIPVLASRNVAVSSVPDVTRWATGGDFSSLLRSEFFGTAKENTGLVLSRKSLLERTPYRKKILKLLNDLKGMTTKEDFTTLIACLGSGAALTAEVEINPLSYKIDSHADHVGRHIISQREVWEQVAELFKIAKKARWKNSHLSVFDRTTFAVVSDFGRTPFLNANSGKDHNPSVNSVLLAGKGIRGGRVIGKSLLVSRKKSPTRQSLHVGAPLDYTTFHTVDDPKKAALDNVDFIYPENVMATIYRSMGMQTEAKVLEKILKT